MSKEESKIEAREEPLQRADTPQVPMVGATRLSGNNILEEDLFDRGTVTLKNDKAQMNALEIINETPEE